MPSQPPSEPVSANPLLQAITKLYDSRAPTYDTDHDAWHVTLAQDFISWCLPYLPPSFTSLSEATSTPLPPPLLRHLDICTGTGLIALSSLQHFNTAHKNTATALSIDAVDISTASLAIAVARPEVRDILRADSISAGSEQAGGRVRFFLGSATSLSSVVPFVAASNDGQKEDSTTTSTTTTRPWLEKGSYDLITCCSGLVLLGRGSGATGRKEFVNILEEWKTYLRPGTGVLIFDVPSPETQVPGLLFGRAVENCLEGEAGSRSGQVQVIGRDVFRNGEGDVRGVIENAGMVVRRVWEVGPWRGRAYKEDDWEGVWEGVSKIGIPDLGGLEERVREKIREEFGRLWREKAVNGVVWDETRLMIGVAGWEGV